MAEFIDIFDANMKPVAPFRLERKEVVKTQHWHHVFDCWVMRRDPAGDRMLLQLRAKTKANNPNTLDISAAGWLQSGETLQDGFREVEEELGIKTNPDEFYYLGMVKEAVDRENFYTRNFCHTFFHETQHQLSDYKPQFLEVDGLFEITVSDGLKLFSGETAAIEAVGIVKSGDVYVPETRKIGINDMCSAYDRCTVTKYYLKIFTLAGLYLKGVRPLVI